MHPLSTRSTPPNIVLCCLFVHSAGAGAGCLYLAADNVASVLLYTPLRPTLTSD